MKKSTVFKVNGKQYRHSEIFDQQFSLTSGGVVAGFEVIYKIPTTYLTDSNNVTVNSSGTNGGSASDISTNIRFTK